MENLFGANYLFSSTTFLVVLFLIFEEIVNVEQIVRESYFSHIASCDNLLVFTN